MVRTATRRSFTAWAMTALVAIGCENGQPRLFVDVQTDFVPGLEFSFIDVSVAGSGSSCDRSGDELARVTRAAGVDDLGEFARGLRVGAFEGLRPGNYVVRGLLREPPANPGAGVDSGPILARRCVLATVTSSRVVLLPFLAACGELSCPPAGAPSLTECIEGACVDPRCDLADARARGDFCDADDLCESDADCRTASRCAAARCVASTAGVGLCVVGDDVAGSCPAGAYCSRETGECEPLSDERMDAGVPDASTPSDPDAAAPDASAVDAASDDASAFDDAPIASPDAFVAIDAFVRPDAPASVDAAMSADAPRPPDAGRDAWAPDAYAVDAYAMDACSATFANCDATPGCETDLLSSESHCGACGVACGMNEVCYGDGRCRCGTTPGTPAGGAVCDDYLAHATGRCTGGVTPGCAIVTCESGWGNCDGLGYTGCEASLATTSNCGSCGTACVSGETCTSGSCRCNGGAACSAGQVCRVGCGCVPATETLCRTTTGDEDCDGLPNCSDPDCNGRICAGAGTMCVGGDCF